MNRLRRLLLVVPFIATLIVPLYGYHDPVVWGFPFVYWYQFAWIPLSSLLTLVVYRGTRR
jgi:hypothetical protein